MDLAARLPVVLHLMQLQTQAVSPGETSFQPADPNAAQDGLLAHNFLRSTLAANESPTAGSLR